MKIKQWVIDETAFQMKSFGYSPNDIPAIRTVSNAVMEIMEEDGLATRKQTDRLSQDEIIKAVKRKLKKVI